jgi:hypothetical protein
MNGSLKLLSPLVAALALAACNAPSSSSIPGPTGYSQTRITSATHHIPEWQAKHLARPACPQVVGKPSCMALIVTKGVTPDCSGSSCGIGALQLEKAYNLTSSLGNGSGQVVAVVEVGDDADAASSVTTYRNEFNLGTPSFNKYNQVGQEYDYPSSCENFGWCVETDLDIEMVSASCPKCTIDLIEADSSDTSDLEQAEATAVSVGATIVSNSWQCGGSNNCGDPNFKNYFDTPGIAYLASSGDGGYQDVGAPSALASVLSVGGTQLHISGSHVVETIWNDAGAGCVSGIAKPSWQTDPDCKDRTSSDVSAQAGVSPGVAIYVGLYGEWGSVGGTSVSSPFTAGVIGLAGNASSENGGENFWTLTKKEHKKDFRVITSGNDGFCNGEYLCTAGAKGKKKFFTYSGPGGWGTPNGITAY